MKYNVKFKNSNFEEEIIADGFSETSTSGFLTFYNYEKTFWQKRKDFLLLDKFSILRIGIKP